MKKKTFWIVGILVFLILIGFLGNWYVGNRLKKILEKEASLTTYEKLDVNIFLNSFSIENIQIEEPRFSAGANKISASGLSYYKFLFRDRIEIDELEVRVPKITLFPADSSKGKKEQQGHILISSVILKEGTLQKKQNDTAKASLFLSFPEAAFQNIHSGMTVSDVNSYKVQLDSLYLKINPEHYLTIKEASAENGVIQLLDFRIQSPFPPGEFDRRIPHEKDLITLKIPEIYLDSLSVNNVGDSLYFQNPKMTFNDAHLSIYRNKLVKDGTTTKPLFNKLLRELPFKLNLEQLQVNNSEIIYEEKVKAEVGPATLRLAGINVQLNDLHNIQNISAQPQLSGNADLMRGTPVKLEFTFPVFDPQNSFRVSGTFGRLEGEALDPFLIPALNLRARGTMNSASFNFNGNEDLLQGDFSIDYETFEIEILDDSGEDKKGFLSSIANLFVDNEKEPDETPGEDVNVKRVKQRSFWNFLWMGIQDGLRKSLGQL